MSMDKNKKTKLGMELKRTPRGRKIYRGAYNYFRGDSLYSEEEFEVWKDKKEMSMSFFSKLHSRVATGELLTIYVDYVINKDFIPQHVLVEKTLGSESVTEIYDYDRKNNQLDYIFISKDGEEHAQMKAGAKFHISTPTTATSILFLRLKKEDTTAKNFYNVFQSYNNWSFEKQPEVQTVCLQRISVAQENLQLEGNTVQALQYKLFQDNPDPEAPIPDYLRVYVSKHSAIPYMVKAEDGTMIQMKYFNDLDND